MTLAPRAGFEPGTYRLQPDAQLSYPTSLPETTFEIAVRDIPRSHGMTERIRHPMHADRWGGNADSSPGAEPVP